MMPDQKLALRSAKLGQSVFWLLLSLSVILVMFALWQWHPFGTVAYERSDYSEQLPLSTGADEQVVDQAVIKAAARATFEVDYATRMFALAHNDLAALLATSTRTIATTSTSGSSIIEVPPKDARSLYASHQSAWPAERTYPTDGAILPFHRIVAYYGNFYSTRMGALGEYEPEEMKRRLLADVAKWEQADPETPVMPAIDYIAVVAQADAGADGMYRNRMPDSEIQKAVTLAQEIGGIVILEIQPGLANLQGEIEALEDWLKLPQVHVAIDPEFVMKTGDRPGTVIGSVNAADVNNAIVYLDSLVATYNLPPKVLLVHRFTGPMVKQAADIIPTPTTQVVIVMDGWGAPGNKFATYNQIVAPEPVQFTGFKIFYKNDLKPPSQGLLTPAEILTLSPRPIFIQYQ